MSRKLILITAAAGILLLSGCGTAQPKNTASISAESTVPKENTDTDTVDGVFTNADKNFQIAVPAGWREKPSETTRDKTIYFSPNGDSSLELRRQEADPNLLAYSRTDFEKSYGAQFRNFKLTAFEPISANESKGIYLAYTCVQGDVTYSVYQGVFAGEYDYNITYSTIAPNDKFAAMAKANLQTFREIDPFSDSKLLLGRLDGQTYTAKDNGYTLQLPKNWRFSEQNASRVLFVDSTGKYNMNIMVSDIDKKLFSYKKSYFSDYFKEALDSSASLKKLETITVGDYKARYLECSYTYGGQNLYARQYLINQGEHTYAITLTTASGSQNKVDLETVVKSLKIQE